MSEQEIKIPLRKRAISRSDPGILRHTSELSYDQRSQSLDPPGNQKGLQLSFTYPSARTSPEPTPKLNKTKLNNKIPSTYLNFDDYTPPDIKQNMYVSNINSHTLDGKYIWYYAIVESNITFIKRQIFFKVLIGTPILKGAYNECNTLFSSLYLEEKYPSHVSYNINPIKYDVGLAKKFMDLFYLQIEYYYTYDTFIVGFGEHEREKISSTYQFVLLCETPNRDEIPSS